MESTSTLLAAEQIPRIEADTPWKNILDKYLSEFMEYCLPDIAANIDWSRNYESLDKELNAITRGAKLGRRVTDKLMKVWLNNGQETWILCHLEVQGQKNPKFPQRMFIYNYRLSDRYQVPIISMAILTDNDPDWRPNQYRQGMFGCDIEMNFLVIKILDFAPRRQELENSCKPFALVILAQLTLLESPKNARTRLSAKIALTRRLYRCGFSKEDIFHLFAFIDWLIALPEPLMIEYEQQIEQLKEKKMARFITTPERVGRIRGRREGIQLMGELIIRILRQFGSIPLSLIAKIQQSDPETLSVWEEKIAAADKIEDIS
jgi:hypothetical protein